MKTLFENDNCFTSLRATKVKDLSASWNVYVNVCRWSQNWACRSWDEKPQDKAIILLKLVSGHASLPPVRQSRMDMWKRRYSWIVFNCTVTHYFRLFSIFTYRISCLSMRISLRFNDVSALTPVKTAAVVVFWWLVASKSCLPLTIRKWSVNKRDFHFDPSFQTRVQTSSTRSNLPLCSLPFFFASSSLPSFFVWICLSDSPTIIRLQLLLV